jgi:hypothetical protein
MLTLLLENVQFVTSRGPALSIAPPQQPSPVHALSKNVLLVTVSRPFLGLAPVHERPALLMAPPDALAVLAAKMLLETVSFPRLVLAIAPP